MKKYLSLVLVIFLTKFSFGNVLKEIMPDFVIISDEIDTSIGTGLYVIEGKIISESTNKLIKNTTIDVDGMGKFVSKSGYFELKVSVASAYVVFYNQMIRDIYYKNPKPSEKRRIKIIIYAKEFTGEDYKLEEKPVIYAYSEKPILFNLKLKTKGKLIFTYPKLPQDSIWKMQTVQNGNMSDEQGNLFPYLFWESKKLEPIRFLEGNNFIYGVVLKREDVLTYLDSVLNFMNFNSKEKTDFITYWGPRLVQKDYSFVQFQIQDDCNQFAKYEIYPTPDNLNRLFILFYCFDDKQEFQANLTKEIKKQEFKSFSRSGFNLLEWGGIEIGKIK